MIWMNIKKYEEIKRRIVALALASSIGFTSFALSGCKSKNDIIDGEASNGYSSVLDRDNSIDMNNSGEWFCDVWAEDYDNNKISGIKFELRDNKNNLIEEWTSSNTPHRITGLSAGKYIINEINVVGDYMTSNNNYTYEINTYESNQNVFAIKHIKKGVVLEDKTNNILNTGKKEYIDDKLFVLKLKESYLNKMNNKDFIIDSNNKNIDINDIPKYLVLKGSQMERNDSISIGSIQYSFRDVITLNDDDVSETEASITCNKDGSYQTILYRTYLGLKGSIYNDNLYIVPIDDLTKEELNELIEEHKDNTNVMSVLKARGYYNDDYSINKTRVLVKNK